VIKFIRGQNSNEFWKVKTSREGMLQTFRVFASATFVFLFVLIVMSILNAIKVLSWFGDFLIILFLLVGVFVLFQLLFLRELPLHHSSSNTSKRNQISSFPLTGTETILQREMLVEELYAKLSQVDTTAIILTGIEGSGKSTLAALLYRYVEEHRRLSNQQFAEESLWLSVNENANMAELGATIYSALGKPVPYFNSLAPRDQAIALFTAMNTVEHPRLIVLDQFDNLLNGQLGLVRADRPGINEWLDALNSQLCKCHVLFTSRFSLKGTRRSPLVYIQEISLEGLNIAEGIELLSRKLGTTEPQISTSDLRKIVRIYNGHPLALTQIASTLKSNQQLRINAFFEYKNILQQTGSIIDLLIKKYIEQLTPVQRKVLFAFSVYREAVPVKAAWMIFEEISKKQLLPAIDVLLLQHLLQSHEEICYQPHPIITHDVVKHFTDVSNQRNQEVLILAHESAAKYYKEHFVKSSQKKIRQEPKDIHPIVEAIWHLCHAKRWTEAYDLMKTENVFQDLKRWGGNETLLDLCQLLLPLTKKNPNSKESIYIYTDLGRIYRTLGRRELALEYFEKALSICEREHFIREQGMLHSLIGVVYANLGQSRQAMVNLEKALSIRQELKDQDGEGWTLYNLARVYHEQGQEELAQQYCKDALNLFREMKNRKGEVRILYLLGRINDHLGKKEQAFKFYEEAITISEDIRDRLGEAQTLNGLALYYLDLQEKDYALELLEEALKIRQEISDREGEGRALNDLGRFYRIFGEKEKAKEFLERALSICREIEDYEGISKTLNNLSMIQSDEEAQKSLNEALHISQEIGDRRVEGWTLHNMGRVYSNIGNLEQAKRCYKQALRIRREVEDIRGEGWTMYNLGLLYAKESNYEQALALFQQARKIVKEFKNSTHAQTPSSIENLQQAIGKEGFAVLKGSLRRRTNITVDQILNGDD
jgi:tetratricopeptide (TPR) repeat protein